jgi:hypothetical protein
MNMHNRIQEKVVHSELEHTAQEKIDLESW